MVRDRIAAAVRLVAAEAPSKTLMRQIGDGPLRSGSATIENQRLRRVCSQATAVGLARRRDVSETVNASEKGIATGIGIASVTGIGIVKETVITGSETATTTDMPDPDEAKTAITLETATVEKGTKIVSVRSGDLSTRARWTSSTMVTKPPLVLQAPDADAPTMRMALVAETLGTPRYVCLQPRLYQEDPLG